MPVATLTRQLEHKTPPFAALLHLLARLREHVGGREGRSTCSDLERVFVPNGWWWALPAEKMRQVFQQLFEVLKAGRRGQADVPSPAMLVNTLKLGLTLRTLEDPFAPPPLERQLADVTKGMASFYSVVSIKESDRWALHAKAFFSAANLKRCADGFAPPSDRDVLERILWGLEAEGAALRHRIQPAGEEGEYETLVPAPSPTVALGLFNHLVVTAQEQVRHLTQTFNHLIDLANTPARYQPQMLDAKSLSHRQRVIYGRRGAGAGGPGGAFA
ncbi:hypothetical protein JCM6882_003446 [Rhodosporidiobolus microsporus]